MIPIVITHQKDLWKQSTAFNGGNSWLAVREDLHDWMVENLNGYYVITYEPKWHATAVHVTWGKAAIVLTFTSERDAVLFKTFWL